jgi:hypothetical protein
MLRRWILIGALVGALPALGQTGRQPGGRRAGGNQAQTNPSAQDKDLLPSFTGTRRGIDSKGLTLEEPGPNLLEFRCSKKTKYADGAKKLKSSDLKPGDSVAIDARRALDGTLDAVNVRRDHPQPPPE